MTHHSEPLALVPLATLTLRLRAPARLDDAPAGGRWIVEAESGRLDGEHIHGSVSGHASADWLALGPGGVGTVDARLLLTTDDGAAVLIQYNGRTDLAQRGAPIYIAPRFDTGDDRYAWLNRVQAVGRGDFAEDGSLVYALHEVR